MCVWVSALVWQGPMVSCLSVRSLAAISACGSRSNIHTTRTHSSTLTHTPSAQKQFSSSCLFCRTVCHRNVTSVCTGCMHVCLSIDCTFNHVTALISSHCPACPPPSLFLSHSPPLFMLFSGFLDKCRGEIKGVLLFWKAQMPHSCQENTSTKLCVAWQQSTPAYWEILVWQKI